MAPEELLVTPGAPEELLGALVGVFWWPEDRGFAHVGVFWLPEERNSLMLASSGGQKTLDLLICWPLLVLSSVLIVAQLLPRYPLC